MNNTKDDVFLKHKSRFRKSSRIFVCVFVFVVLFCGIFWSVKTYGLPQTLCTPSENHQSQNGEVAENGSETGDKEQNNEDDAHGSVPDEGGTVENPNEDIENTFPIIGETVLLQPLHIKVLKVDAGNIENYLGWQYGYYVVAVDSSIMPESLLYARFLEAGPCKTIESALLYMKEMNVGETLPFVFETQTGRITYTFVKE